MTTEPTPPAAVLTEEQVSEIRALNAQRDEESPWLMRTADTRWLLERAARAAIIPALDKIAALTAERDALFEMLTEARGYLPECIGITEEIDYLIDAALRDGGEEQ